MFGRSTLLKYNVSVEYQTNKIYCNHFSQTSQNFHKCIIVWHFLSTVYIINFHHVCTFQSVSYLSVSPQLPFLRHTLTLQKSQAISDIQPNKECNLFSNTSFNDAFFVTQNSTSISVDSCIEKLCTCKKIILEWIK